MHQVTKKGLLLALFCLSLGSKCNKTAGEFFNRPEFRACITLEEQGKYACNGVIKEIPAGLIVPETLDEYEQAESYYNDKEERLYICLRFPEECR